MPNPRLPITGPGTRLFGGRHQCVMRHIPDNTTCWMDTIDAERILDEHPAEWAFYGADADASTADAYTPKVRVS